jgi:hypothetical protein
MGNENYDTKQALHKILDRGAELIDTHLKDQPEAYAELLTSLGMSYRGLADYDRAEAMLKTSRNIGRERFGAGSAMVLQSEYFWPDAHTIVETMRWPSSNIERLLVRAIN